MDYQLIIDYTIGCWGYSKQYVRSILAGYKGKHIDVKISSYGGDLDHGLDIRQQFVDHGDVTVHIHGFTASAATVIAMGAKKVCMSRYAMFLVHKCSNFIDVWGNLNADEMQKLIEDLTENKKENDKIDVVLANLYAARCKKKVSEILDVLKAGRWLTAQEALDYGFIDEIEDEPAGKAPVIDAALKSKLNAFGLGTDGLDAAPSSERESLFAKIKTSLFGPRNAASAEENDGAPSATVEEEGNLNSNSNSTAMKKITLAAAIAAVLAVESVEVSDDGTVKIKEADFGKLSSKLDELTAQIDKKDAEIEQLKKDVKALEDAPADTTDDIKDDAGEAKVSAADMYNSIKNSL